MESTTEFYSIPEAARRCGVSRATMWNWVKSGKVKAFVTPGGHHRIHTEQIADLMEGKSVEKPQEISTKCVLVADDDEPLRKLYIRRLQSRGYEVLSASNGFEAGLLVSSKRPDLVLLDLFMEGGDGFEACRMIKADPELKQTIIIAMSGVADTSLKTRIMAVGADDFFPKSQGVNVILATIESLLGPAAKA